MTRPKAAPKREPIAPDEDGACRRCGLIFQEPDTTPEETPHKCPPGFLTRAPKRPAPKVKTVRAYAVVCADGRAVRLRFRKKDTPEALRAVERDRICHKCGLLNSGTHRVVPLTGEVKIEGKGK